MRRLLPLALLVPLCTALADSPDDPKPVPVIRAFRAQEHVVVDGALAEPVWHTAGFPGFYQREPDQGSPASERTEVWVAYDDEALYIAARLHDSAPDSIMKILARRDEFFTADWFGFFIDPYHDRRSGYFFGISAAGTMVDGVLYNDDWDDWSWDGIWEGEVRTDRDGWTVEMRIPYTQLRFNQQQEYLWGVNFRRDIGRRNEESYAVYTPRGESGFVSRFVDLVGIRDVSPPPQIEILPYINSKAEYLRHDPSDPFNDGSRLLAGAGADLKVGVGTNLTLDATVNPDFGQVEVDPAVVNLSDVETNYPEKRPFFVEGSTTYNFGQGGATNTWSFNWGNPDLFYSRRIGKAPSGTLPDYDHADVPAGTTILGAAKVTGKLGGTWNFGTAHALTSRETAMISSNGERRRVEIEPLTYYGIARAQREFDQGAQAVGGILTYTGRDFRDQRLSLEMNHDALAGGVDGWAFLDAGRTWVITAWGVYSQVRGTREDITALQRNSRHYFQRPDQPHVRVDSAATSLTGSAGRLYVVKQKGSWMVNASLGFISPGFEINDLGYNYRCDVINSHATVGYKWTEPTSWYRTMDVAAAIFQNLNFGGVNTWRGLFAKSNITLRSFWSLWAIYAYNPKTYDATRSRGGPLMLTLPGREFDLGVSTDSRKELVVSMEAYSYFRTDEPGFSLAAGVEWKPSPSLNLRFSPQFERDISLRQWVASIQDESATETSGRRYVFAIIDQRILSASLRLNWTFTPRLSLQLYVQPLIAAGNYYDFKELSRPSSNDFLHYGANGSSITEQFDAAGRLTSYVVDPDAAGPAQSFTIGNPDFNFSSLRGNAVLRWEYRPGSVFYLVWTQSRSDGLTDGSFLAGRSLSRLIDADADNIFMAKFTYWFDF